MNHCFRKRPAVIEAFQMTAEHRASNVDWPEWLHAAWQKGFETVGALYPVASSLVIHTLEGNLIVSTDDWIIRGVQGELYPCKPDIFVLSYEEVRDDPT
jgi:hypothetical protein